MPEYLHPGVYVEEIELGPKSIEGVSTSTVGFLGETVRGPVNPVFVTSFSEFERIFGGYSAGSFMSYSVDGFFRNGGKRCFISRVIGRRATVASTILNSSGNSKSLYLQATGHGKWGKQYLCEYF